MLHYPRRHNQGYAPHQLGLKAHNYAPLAGGASLSTLEQLTALTAGTNSAIWLPNDLANLRQTSSGETAVVATDPVGFVADVSEFGGLNLNEWLATQPNLVANGDFSSTDVSDWTRGTQSVDGTLEVVAGKLVHTKGASDSTSPRWAKAITGLTVGRWYYAEMDTPTGTASLSRMDFHSSSSGNVGWAITPSGKFYQALATTMYLVAVMQIGNAGETSIYDNIVLKEMPANFHPLLQATTSLKPDAIGGLTLDGVDDFMEWAFPSGSGSTDMTLLMGVSTTDAQWMMATNGSNFLGCAQDGTGTAASFNSGSPTFHVDGGSSLTTRDALHDAITGGTYRRVEARGANLSAWTEMEFGRYNNNPGSGFVFAGNYSAVVILDNVGLGANAASALSLAQTLVDEINGTM